MNEQQLNEAIKFVAELIQNSEWSIDDSDIMDGNIYITICKPLKKEDN